VILSLGLLSCLLAQTAQPADAKRAAAQLIDQGNELLRRRQYEAALALYQAAHEKYPTPKIFFNMAEAYRELKSFVEAIELYERFLAESGVDAGSPLSREAAGAIADLETRIARISLDGGPPEAEVFVDGQPAGRLPLARHRVLPGVHQVLLQKEGFVSRRIEVAVKSGEDHRVDATLEPIAPPPSPPAIAVTTPVERTSQPEDEGSIAGKWWFWTLIGGAVVIGVGAAVIATTSGGDDFTLGGDLGVSSTSDWRRL
jgi:hypothetical protein